MNLITYQKLRKEMSNPYIKNITAMSLTELGMEAERVNRGLSSRFRKGNSINEAAQLIQGMYLRISRNLFSLATPADLYDEAKKHGITAKEMNTTFYKQP